MSRTTIAHRRAVTSGEIAALRVAVEKVFAPEPNVVAAYLYGSAARGELARDLDVGVVTRTDVAYTTLERWASELQARGAPHGPEINLRPLGRAAPRFRVTVLREGRLLYEGDPRARLAFEARAASDWADFGPVWRRVRARVMERWQGG